MARIGGVGVAPLADRDGPLKARLGIGERCPGGWPGRGVPDGSRASRRDDDSGFKLRFLMLPVVPAVRGNPQASAPPDFRRLRRTIRLEVGRFSRRLGNLSADRR
jgi:hypothetical protein